MTTACICNCSGTELSFCTSIAVYFICPRHGYENLNNVGKFISKKIMEKKRTSENTREIQYGKERQRLISKPNDKWYLANAICYIVLHRMIVKSKTMYNEISAQKKLNKSKCLAIFFIFALAETFFFSLHPIPQLLLVVFPFHTDFSCTSNGQWATDIYTPF